MTPRGSDKPGGDRQPGEAGRSGSPPDKPSGTDPASPWHHRQVSKLHVRRYGPAGPVQVLAIHGLTGHGQRWQRLASGHLPGVSVAAPDLLGHGRSTWVPPWTIEANVAALASMLADQGDTLAVVVGHSFGGAVALHLAAAHPDRVGALVLLDPAIGLDGAWMREVADAMLASPDYPDIAEARAEKATGSWADVDPAVLDAELDEHLIALPGGRYGWRISLPAMMSYWSELARGIVLPPKGIETVLVRAAWTSPPYVGEDLIGGLREQLGSDFALMDFDCAHMVAQAKPAEVAAVIRSRMC
jgi:lipase